MKKRVLLLVTLFVSCFALLACGKSNDLIGTWKGLSDGESRGDQIEATFVFGSNDEVEYSNEFGFSGKGTYKIEDNKVTIKIDLWENEKVYEFKVDGDKLSLKATDSISPSYSELIKQK